MEWLSGLTYNQAGRQHDFLVAIGRAFGNFEQQFGTLIAKNVEILLHCAQGDFGELGALEIVKADQGYLFRDTDIKCGQLLYYLKGPLIVGAEKSGQLPL